MSNAIEAMTAFNEKNDGSVSVVVETPKDSAIKYSYCPHSHMFRAKRTLADGMVFPFNLGFVPETLAEDGDPLDISIVDPVPYVCSCLVRARLLAVIEAEQTENGKMVRNDRIVGMAIDEETPPEFLSVPFDDSRIRQIVFFFTSYNTINGKVFKALRTGNERDGAWLIHEAIERLEINAKKLEQRLKAA
jgi:inorganic pyrophosphatase